MKIAKPKKPYPEFPLFAHGAKQWAKKIKGKMWYFGTWDDPEAAMEKYKAEVHEIQAGRDPRRLKKAHVSPGELTVYDMTNLYLVRQEQRVSTGDITKRHFSDCFQSCKRVSTYFGKFQSASTLKAADFQALRGTFPATWGPTRTKIELSRIKTCFKWAFESELIPALPNFGPDFKAPTKSVNRRDQQQRRAVRGGKLDFAAAEIQKLLKASTGWLRACILLGINGGMGNSECGRLSPACLDLKAGWYDMPRHKTGVDRRFNLWPETITAIQTAMADRKIQHELCFLTKRNAPVWFEVTSKSGVTAFRDALGKAFRALCIDCGIERSQRAFYSLRRTFETKAGDSKDQVAVDVCMGHADPSMGGIYRQGIDDKRLIDVGQHVHDWLFPKPAKKKPAKRAAKKAAAK